MASVSITCSGNKVQAQVSIEDSDLSSNELNEQAVALLAVALKYTYDFDNGVLPSIVTDITF